MSTKTKNIASKDFDLLNQKVDEINDEVKQLSKHNYEKLFFLSSNFNTEIPKLNCLMNSSKYEFSIIPTQSSVILNAAIQNYNAEDKDLDSVTKIFLRSNKSIIDTIFKNTDVTSDLCYFILLKNDTESNRNKIFAFYDNFDFITNISKIFFQFVPPSLKEYFKNNKKEISLT